MFISLIGAFYVNVNTQKDKGKTFKKHILKVTIHRGLNNKIRELQKEHQQVIEEKDAALSFVFDGVQDRDNQRQAIQYENVALQGQRDIYQAQLERHQDQIQT